MVESGILLRCCRGNFTEGSNPSLSVLNKAPLKFRGVLLYNLTYLLEYEDMLSKDFTLCKQAGVLNSPRPPLKSLLP